MSGKQISPEDRGRHFAAKAEGDSKPALSRFGAGERLLGAERAHIDRMILHGLDWIADNVDAGGEP
jgi:hypothetical protein